MESGQKLIKLGDKSVAWDDSFRLFFTTKLGNPHYSPEVMAKTMLINYSVTRDGLANQLLNVVVGHERPDLEEQFSELVADMSANALMIVKLEDTLLHELSASEGNILDNSDLIETLNQTKETSTAIKAKVEQAEFTKAEISKARLGYTPVAKRGSILYFVMASLSTISSMYETSLDSFLGVFNKALDHAKKDVVLDNRLRNMSESVMRDVYDYTCTGIFERHKLMFAFQMTCQVQDGCVARRPFNLRRHRRDCPRPKLTGRCAQERRPQPRRTRRVPQGRHGPRRAAAGLSGLMARRVRLEGPVGALRDERRVRCLAKGLRKK